MKTIMKSLLLVMVITTAGCKKFVEVAPPPDAVLSSQVFSNDAKASAAVNGVYSYMMNPSPTFSSWMTTIYAGAAADELLRFNAKVADDEFIKNEITPTNTNNGRLWTTAYRVIYQANACIEGLQASQTMTESLRLQLLGECYFLRAFSHCYLVNLFGDVPLTLTTDWATNSVQGRNNKEDVIKQIEQDLLEAKSLVNVAYPSTGRGRPNKWAVTAMLARFYLYAGDWAKAEKEAGEVLSSPLYSPLPALNKVFISGSTEAIWQLVPDPAKLAYIPELLDGGYYPLPAPQFYLRPGFTSHFETGDQRRNAWLDSVTYSGTKYYYPGKYKDMSMTSKEYYVALRVGEQWLIRAEARTKLQKYSEAAADLNTVRARAGLPNYNGALNEQALLDAIAAERRVELFAEWGHRWFDLKRTGKADAVLGALKGSSWKSTDLLWPVPQNEIINNINLVQNEGYF